MVTGNPFAPHKLHAVWWETGQFCDDSLSQGQAEQRGSGRLPAGRAPPAPTSVLESAGRQWAEPCAGQRGRE